MREGDYWSPRALSPGCPGTRCVARTGLKLTEMCLPLPGGRRMRRHREGALCPPAPRSPAGPSRAARPASGALPAAHTLPRSPLRDPGPGSAPKTSTEGFGNTRSLPCSCFSTLRVPGQTSPTSPAGCARGAAPLQPPDRTVSGRGARGRGGGRSTARARRSERAETPGLPRRARLGAPVPGATLAPPVQDFQLIPSLGGWGSPCEPAGATAGLLGSRAGTPRREHC